MPKFSEKEEKKPAYKPSQREALDLSEKLKGYTKKLVNGRNQYPFELFLEAQNIISFDKFDMIQVKNPTAYKKYIDINGLRQWIEEQEMEKLFIAHPEERVAYDEKIKEMFRDIKSLFNSKTA